MTFQCLTFCRRPEFQLWEILLAIALTVRCINIDEASQICAGIGNIDTCAGDSGGPMLSNELSPLKRYSVIGITSFGVQCADANFPGVYTRVDNYLDWIAQ